MNRNAFYPGLLILLAALICLRGNISAIRWYARSNIKEEDKPKHARLVGVGLLVISLTLIFGAWLETAQRGVLFWLPALGVRLGVGIIGYAQYKYVKRS